MKILFRIFAAFFAAASVSLSPGGGLAAEAQPKPVLMVIANQDFYWREYADTRSPLEAQGLEVIVAAATTETARPHANSGQGSDGGFVQPDLALADVNADDYSAIVFVGGYGAASYQYANETTYDNPAYNRDPNVVGVVNDLINDFVEQDKHVAAVCYGVSVLAWARVDGVSPLEGRTVTAWAGTLPGHTRNGQQHADNTVAVRTEIEANGANMAFSAAPGDPLAYGDDVIVDGNIITAENYLSAKHFGKTIAEAVGAPKKPRPRLRPRRR